MIKNTFPVNEARLLIETPKDTPQIGFLGGEQGREIDASIKTDYKDFPVMQKGNYSEGIIKNSNPFYTVGVQSKIPVGVRVASQSDLETAMKVNALNLTGTYEDTGLVLRTDGDPNEYLAGNLMRQVKDRLGKKAKMPVMIPLYEIELAKDQNSPYGLAFKLKDDAEIIYAPILNKSAGSKFNSKDIDTKTGLPTKVGNGNRTFWTRNSGLSRLCLNWGLSLNSNDGDLALSSGDGRVVLVTAEGGSQEYFNEKLADLQRTRDAQIADINNKYKKAEAILRR